MTSERRCPVYRVVVQQGGAHIDVLLADEDERAITRLVAERRPFQLWARKGGGGVESLTVAPALGHFRHISIAAPSIPMSAAGRPAAQGEAVVGHLSAFEHTERYIASMGGLAKLAPFEDNSDLADAITRLSGQIADLIATRG